MNLLTHRRSPATLAFLAIAVAVSSVGAQQPQEDRRAVERALHGYFDALVRHDREGISRFVTDDFTLIENGYPIDFERFTRAWDPERPGTQVYDLGDLDIEVHGSVAVFRYDLEWRSGGVRTFRGIETGFARRGEDGWRFARFHGTWLVDPAEVDPGELSDYAGEYGSEPAPRFLAYVEDGHLMLRLANGGSWVAGLREAELIPIAPDRFVLEFAESTVHFERDSTTGEIAALVLDRGARPALRLERAGSRR